jgi:hypothetical protein
MKLKVFVGRARGLLAAVTLLCGMPVSVWQLSVMGDQLRLHESALGTSLKLAGDVMHVRQSTSDPVVAQQLDKATSQWQSGMKAMAGDAAATSSFRRQAELVLLQGGLWLLLYILVMLQYVSSRWSARALRGRDRSKSALADEH